MQPQLMWMRSVSVFGLSRVLPLIVAYLLFLLTARQKNMYLNSIPSSVTFSVAIINKDKLCCASCSSVARIVASLIVAATQFTASEGAKDVTVPEPVRLAGSLFRCVCPACLQRSGKWHTVEGFTVFATACVAWFGSYEVCEFIESSTLISVPVVDKWKLCLHSVFVTYANSLSLLVLNTFPSS